MKRFDHNPETILNAIIEAEKKFPVHLWKINGIQFWPFLRTSLAYTQWKPIKSNTKQRKSNSSYTLLKKYWKIIFKVPFHIWSLKRKLLTAKRIFVGAATHRVLVQNLNVNRYFDVAIRDFNLKIDPAVMLDRGTSLKKNNYPNKESWFSLPSIYIFYEALKRFRLIKPNLYTIELKDYELFYDYLLKNFENPEHLKINFSRKAIERSMRVFHDRKEFLKGLLKGSEVKNVYFLCYYSSLYYPLIAACNELKINTTDVQHGGMGKGHWSYDNWHNPPTEGFRLLPRFFWTWDEHSASLINSWASQTKYHKALHMGTPWKNDYVALQSENLSDTPRILVIMTDFTVEHYILETAKLSGPKYQWVFRMHPRMTKKRQLLEQQLVDYGLVGKASIEDSTISLLSNSLMYCSVMISASSGSVIEAIQSGITPILVPSPGLNYYDSYIKSGEIKLLSEKTPGALAAILDETFSEVSKIRHNKDKPVEYVNKFVDYEQIIARQ